MSTHEVRLPLLDLAAQQGREPRKYTTVVADPPWRYNVKPPEGGTSYGTMTQEELLCMPVGMWSAENAHLYLWVTNSFLVEAHQLVKAWGFEYKTLLTWIKRNEPKDQPTDDRWIGMGYYFRGVTEHVLFATRGSLPVRRKDVANVFYAPHRTHSEKPDAFYNLMASMSPGPYLDVFARKSRWVGDAHLEVMDTFGDESFNFGTTLPPDAFLAK